MFPQTPTTTARFDRILTMIREQVDALNEAYGLDTGFDARGVQHPCVTFGYIGNDANVSHYVFLPHPGRIGTDEDHIGNGFGYNDERGAAATLAAVASAVKIAKSVASLRKMGLVK